MEIAETLKALFDVGGVVVVTVMLWLVWQRLNLLTDKLIDILGEMQDRALIARAEELTKDNET